MAYSTNATVPRAVPVNHTGIKDAPPLEGDFKAVVSSVAAELRTVLNSS